MVWDRCTYSDNIREPALPAALSPSRGNFRLGPRNAATLYCPSLSLHFFLFAHFSLLSFSPLSTALSPFITSFLHLRELISIFFLSCKNTCSYIHPYLVLFVKRNLFQWDGNQMKGNHAVTVQLLIVPPHPTRFIDCEPQTRQMLSLYASSVSYIHLPSRNSWLLQYLFDCSEWVPPVCSMRCPWSQCIHPTCPCLRHPIAAVLSVKLKNYPKEA